MPGTPEQNVVAERKNRTLMYRVRNMTSRTNLPEWFLGEALKIAVYILNIFSNKPVFKTPFELWTVKKPRFLIFMFGVVCRR